MALRKEKGKKRGIPCFWGLVRPLDFFTGCACSSSSGWHATSCITARKRLFTDIEVAHPPDAMR